MTLRVTAVIFALLAPTVAAQSECMFEVPDPRRQYTPAVNAELNVTRLWENGRFVDGAVVVEKVKRFVWTGSVEDGAEQTTEEWDGEAWVLTHRSSTEFEERRPTLTLARLVSDATSASRDVFQYSAMGHLLSQTRSFQPSPNAPWEHDKRDIYTRDGSDRPASFVYETFGRQGPEVWDTEYAVSFEYDASGRLAGCEYAAPEGDGLAPYLQRDLLYDGQERFIAYVSTRLDTGAADSTARSFDASGHVTEVATYESISTVPQRTWKAQRRFTFEYDGDDLIRSTEDIGEGNSTDPTWHDHRRSTYVYDAGYLVEDTLEKLYDTGWGVYIRYTYTFGNSPRSTASEGFADETDLGLVVAPNPGIQMSVRFIAAGDTRVEVYDMLGRRAHVAYTGSDTGPVTVDLATERLAPGAYLVRVQTGGATRSMPVTVVR